MTLGRAEAKKDAPKAGTEANVNITGIMTVTGIDAIDLTEVTEPTGITGETVSRDITREARDMMVID